MTATPAQFAPGTHWEYTNPSTGDTRRFSINHAGRAIKADGLPYILAPWDRFYWGDAPTPEFRELVLVPKDLRERIGFELDTLADEVETNHGDATYAERVRIQDAYRYSAEVARGESA